MFVVLPDNIDNKSMKSIIKRGNLICKQNTLKLKTLKQVEIIYTRINNVTKTDCHGKVNIKNEKIIIC